MRETSSPKHLHPGSPGEWQDQTGSTRPPRLHLPLTCALQVHSDSESKRIQNHSMKLPNLHTFLGRVSLQPSDAAGKTCLPEAAVSRDPLPVSQPLSCPLCIPASTIALGRKSAKCPHAKASRGFEVVVFTRTSAFSISQTAFHHSKECLIPRSFTRKEPLNFAFWIPIAREGNWLCLCLLLDLRSTRYTHDTLFCPQHFGWDVFSSSQKTNI